MTVPRSDGPWVAERPVGVRGRFGVDAMGGITRDTRNYPATAGWLCSGSAHCTISRPTAPKFSAKIPSDGHNHLRRRRRTDLRHGYRFLVTVSRDSALAVSVRRIALGRHRLWGSPACCLGTVRVPVPTTCVPTVSSLRRTEAGGSVRHLARGGAVQRSRCSPVGRVRNQIRGSALDRDRPKADDCWTTRPGRRPER